MTSKTRERPRAFDAEACGGSGGTVTGPGAGSVEASDILEPPVWRVVFRRHPLDSSIGNEIVAGAARVAVVHAGAQCECAAFRCPNRPERAAGAVEVEQNAVAAGTRAVEDEPLAAGRGRHDERSAAAYARRHFIHVGDRSLDAPRAKEHALRHRPPPAREGRNESTREEASASRHRSHAPQTCSRRGSVSPRPSLPAAGWQ